MRVQHSFASHTRTDAHGAFAATESAGEEGSGDDSAKAARKKHKANKGGEGKEEDGGDEDGDDEESELSSEHVSASIGSMGSDLEEHEDDPYAAMEKDLQAQKEEEDKRKAQEAAYTVEA